MIKRLIIYLNLLIISVSVSGSEYQGRSTYILSGNNWFLWRDVEAQWKDDKLYLPSEITNLSSLPVNPPTGGWDMLNKNNAIQVKVPGTVEEYFTVSEDPRPEHFTGVSWWFREIEIPAELKGKRFILDFESVRMRAEVYLDKKLVAYDLIGESPFQADITDYIHPGEKQTLAVRVTNPGGNFHWQDFTIFKWGNYNVPPGRGFGGIIGRVKLNAVNAVHITDIYMQNTPAITQVNAIVSLKNESGKNVKQDVELIIREKKDPDKIVYHKKINKTSIHIGETTLDIPIILQNARIWDLDSPELYTCEVIIKLGKKIQDNDKREFGFRWFSADGVGKDAVLRLNGRRVMLRSAISWGYFPVTGLIATPEMAERQVKTAKQLGLNMLNFHRSIGSPVVLEKADELGLLYYEEPGSFHSANHDPFIRTIVNEKLKRMVRRDRSHPSLVIYNLINEFGGVLTKDKELIAKRMNDMREAHAVDPSRIMTFTSGWAGNEHAEEDSKTHMLPFDTTLYKKGWFDNHRAGGPETWLETYYKSPKDNLMYTNNRSEVYLRGEEGALSTPPRIQKIYDEIQATGKTGWDGKFWENQYKAFNDMFVQKNLVAYFGTLDSLTRKMGNISFEHQGRRIQGMRMQNIGDGYMVNGWEAMPHDNHSGIVDIYRNPKGDSSVFTYYTQPLYVAVSSRSQIVRLPAEVAVDFYIVNEKDLRGNFVLQISVVDPAGATVYTYKKDVTIQGGDVFGQLLLENTTLPIQTKAGKYRIQAEIQGTNQSVLANGYDEVWAIDWAKEDFKGKGAYYGKENDKIASFYEKETLQQLPIYNTEMKNLDWLVVSRPSLDEPVLIDAEFFSGLKVKYYSDGHAEQLAREDNDVKIDRSFVEGAQPDISISANQSFSMAWEGKLLPPESGQYLLGITTQGGVRLFVDGKRIIDDWNNRDQHTLDRSIVFEANKPVSIRLEYTQGRSSGNVQLKWSLPTASAIEPQKIIDAVKENGTTLVILDAVESWMDIISKNTTIQYEGYYAVGRNWVGGVHFVKNHPLFADLPVNDGMDWPYQAVVHDGDRRLGLRITGEEMIVGSYRSTPFDLGTAVGIIPCGKGQIIFSTLDIADNLHQPSGPSDVARKILANIIKYAAEQSNK